MRAFALLLWLLAAVCLVGAANALKQGDVTGARAIATGGFAFGVAALAIDVFRWVSNR